MNPACNIFIIGPTGAGKSSLGRRLGEHYGRPFIDLDQEIELRAGASASMVFDIEGEAGFRKREAALLESCSQRQGIVMATGAGAVLDAANREYLATRGFVVWLQASIDQQLERLRMDRSRPLLAGEGRRQRLQAMATQREPLYRSIADLVVASVAANLATVSARCIELLDAHWTQVDPADEQRRA
jgi:shikimate kinase